MYHTKVSQNIVTSYRSLDATVAQSQNYLSGVNTTIQLQNLTASSDTNSTAGYVLA